jgi:hypothetical protein
LQSIPAFEAATENFHPLPSSLKRRFTCSSVTIPSPFLQVLDKGNRLSKKGNSNCRSTVFLIVAHQVSPFQALQEMIFARIS